MRRVVFGRKTNGTSAEPGRTWRWNMDLCSRLPGIFLATRPCRFHLMHDRRKEDKQKIYLDWDIIDYINFIYTLCIEFNLLCQTIQIDMCFIFAFFHVTAFLLYGINYWIYHMAISIRIVNICLKIDQCFWTLRPKKI